MNKNNVIGLLLIGGIFILWSVWMTPSAEERLKQEQRRDSIIRVQQAQKALQDSLALERAKLQAQQAEKNAQQTASGVASPGKNNQANRMQYGIFANSSVGDEKIFTVESDLLKLEFTNKGGRILSTELKDYKTFDGQPLILFNSDTTKFNLAFHLNNNYLVQTKDFYFQTVLPENMSGENVKVTGDEAFTFSQRLYVDKDETSFDPDKYIEYVYTVKGNNYMVDYTINFVGMNDLVRPMANYINLEWAVDVRQHEKTVDRWNGETVYYKPLTDDVDYLSETKDDDETLDNKVKWISYKQHFFSTTLIAKESFANAEIKTFTKENINPESRYVKSMQSVVGIPYRLGMDNSIPMSFYFGPNKYNVLRKYKLGLERQIPLGWSFFLLWWINVYAVIPVFNFLGTFGWNYGIIILVLTILLKVVLFPIAYKTYKSTAKMRVLKPEIDELGKKFPKKEDAMKKQQATMALYKKAGVNPMAGCVPMLLQMPILFAMFRFFPASIELRQQAFLWATDLSSYDSIFSWDVSIPILDSVYGNHISLFTLLMTVSTVIYTRINNQMMSSGQQMAGMKTMMYLMPIMFLGIFNNYAAGLSYYYFLANIITFGQMYLIRRTIDEKKIRAKIELNKKKPAKKSKFQQRLEQAQKQRGMKPRK